jgi:transposase-like protein
MKQLERENRELRQANEILRKASAYFAQAELDRRSNGKAWNLRARAFAPRHRIVNSFARRSAY